VGLGNCWEGCCAVMKGERNFSLKTDRCNAKSDYGKIMVYYGTF
jgi:hypothetical protein